MILGLDDSVGLPLGSKETDGLVERMLDGGEDVLGFEENVGSIEGRKLGDALKLGPAVGAGSLWGPVGEPVG